MEENLEAQEVVTVSASQNHTATVIFLHGLGQSNLTWKLVVTEALAPRLPQVQWILPQAADKPVSMNQGMRRPSWFDISRLPPGNDEFDELGVTESIALIENVILSQVHSGLDSRRIVLVGFSQGACLSMMVALTTLHELGGVASLSGWIPPRVRDQMIHTASSLAVLWLHGEADIEVPISYGEDAVSFLRSQVGIPDDLVQFKSYDGLAHAINDEELNDLASWLETLVV